MYATDTVSTHHYKTPPLYDTTTVCSMPLYDTATATPLYDTTTV